jgi:hypothetical protein
MRIRGLVGLCLFAWLTTFVSAQVTTSRLEGVVQDQSGAVVPNAKVVVTNKQTQAHAEVTTDASGNYVLPSLQPGFYTMSVEAAGFRKSVLNNIELNVSDTVAQNVRLEVGQTTESVVVEATTVAVQTSDSQISRAVTMREIDTLPQLGRTPISLTTYQPGVQINANDVSFSRVNGTRQGSNNTTLDGIDVNDAVAPRLGLTLTANNTDSIEEFRIVTEGGKAEYGRSAGGQVELITRSGTNSYHGNAFDYLRNTDLNANTFFNNSAGTPRPLFIQNIYGGSFGGPILHDKLFVFGNFQGIRTDQTISRVRTVPTASARAGLFQYRAPGSTAISTFDILANDPRHLGIDPTVAKYLALYPLPNDNSVGDGLNSAGFRFNNPNSSLSDQFTIKGDYNMSTNHHFFYRHSWQRNSAIDSLNNADAPFPGEVQGTQGGHRWGVAGGWDWTIRPNLVNELRYGHQSALVAFNRPERIPGLEIAANDAAGNGLFTNAILTGYGQGRNSPVNEYTDNLTWVHGKQTFKTGFNLRFTLQNGFDFSGIFTDLTFLRANNNVPPSTIGPSTGISSADRQRFELLYNFLLGRPDSITQSYYSDLSKFQAPGTPRVRNFIFHEYGYFFQDDWKIASNLTLNLGLRWEFSGVPYEQNGFQGTLDQVNNINASSQINNLTVKRSQQWYNNDWNNWAPRFGFSWDPTHKGKMAIRGNFGIFYDRLIGATTSLVDGNTPGFSQTITNFPNQAAGSDVRLSDNPALPVAPGAPVLTLPNDRQNSIVVFNPNLRTGYVESYSLTVQRELFRSTVLEVGYVGNRGVKLFQDVNLNQRKIYGDFLASFKELQAFRATGAAPSPTNTLVRIFGSPTAAVAAIGASTIDQGAVGSAAATVDNLSVNFKKYAAAGLSDFYLRNFPQYNLLVYGNNDGRSYYDSLQVSLRRQAGLFKYAFNYTWSKSMDNTIGSVEGNGFTTPIDSFNERLARGRSDFDRPHVFNFTTVYTLPIGRGQRFASGLPRWADTLLGGWDLGFLGIWESGAPFSVSSGRQTAAAGTNTFANFTGDRNIGAVSRQGNGVFYFTPAQIANFSFPDAGSIGTSGRNAFRGPRYFDIDTSLVKRFKITERQAVTFRAEAYNLFNNVNFGNPGLSLVTPTSFGKISTLIGNPRILQGALRYDF